MHTAAFVTRLWGVTQPQPVARAPVLAPGPGLAHALTACHAPTQGLLHHGGCLVMSAVDVDNNGDRTTLASPGEPLDVMDDEVCSRTGAGRDSHAVPWGAAW